ncbi:MAG: glycerate kinase [Candidatus Metalachnospira sp.]|nr:glycerate kinase [Candidatus Metalachnospira sp.]
MKVVAAVDSFKGSVSSLEAGNAVKEAVLSVDSEAEVLVMPLADGGEGTVDTLVSGMGGKLIETEVTGPLGEKRTAVYGICGNTAIMEMASSSGLPLVPAEKRNPLDTTTYGVGDMIKDALKRGCREFIIGIGGSATNDAGVGMLQSLGFKFYDGGKKEIGLGGRYVADIADIDISGAVPQLKECVFRIACDVDNPLCGKRGASYIYGPQKGANAETVEFLDNALGSFAEVTRKKFGIDCAENPGSGAAGGLGYAFRAYLNGELKPGVEIVLDEIEIDKALVNADYVITGEGRIDSQTAMGKAPAGVAARAKIAGASVIGIAGCVTDDAYLCNDKGIDAIFPVIDRSMTLEEAMDKTTTVKNIKKTVTQIFRLIKAAGR